MRTYANIYFAVFQINTYIIIIGILFTVASILQLFHLTDSWYYVSFSLLFRPIGGNQLIYDTKSFSFIDTRKITYFLHHYLKWILEYSDWMFTCNVKKLYCPILTFVRWIKLRDKQDFSNLAPPKFYFWILIKIQVQRRIWYIMYRLYSSNAWI
jgi:hypothetical protein